MLRNRDELLDYLKKVGYNKNDYRIAVEALIFTKEGKLILEKRGPGCRDEIGKLEGVGGNLKDRTDLHEKLYEEIDEELAAKKVGFEVKIERLLEVRDVQFEERDKRMQNWIVVSYLCRVIKGTPAIGEPENIEELKFLTMDELYEMDESDLSRSTVAARKVYKAKYGNRPYFEVPEDK